MVAQKRALLAEATAPGSSIAAVARKYGIAPNMMFQWRRAMDDSGDEGLKSTEKIAPESEVKKLKARIAELEPALGRKTVDNAILNYAVELPSKKTDIAYPVGKTSRWSVYQTASALGVSRPHLATTLRHPAKVRGATRRQLPRICSSAFVPSSTTDPPKVIDESMPC